MRANQTLKTLVLIPLGLLLASSRGLSQDSRKPLDAATRVSTTEATRAAAKKAAEKDAAKETKKPSTDDAVVELHAVTGAQGKSQETAAPSTETSKKPALNRVHGTVYGTSDAQRARDRGTGANVGATSKSGKTSVFVETERSRNTSPPH